MKIKEVAALARDAGSVTLVNEKDGCEITRRWLMIGGSAMYPLDGMPVLDERTLRCVLDVPMKERETFRVWTMDENDTLERFMLDNERSDVDAIMSAVEINWDGMRLVCAYGEAYGEEVMVDAKWLKPLSDAKKELTYAIRKYKSGENEKRFLVVMNGMLTVASITQSEAWATDRAAKELDVMCRRTMEAAKRNREKMENADK